MHVFRTELVWFVTTKHTHRPVPYSAIFREVASCADGKNTVTHSQIFCRERETLDHAVLNGMSPSNPLPQNSGNHQRRREECKCQKGYGRHQERKVLESTEQSPYDLTDWSQMLEPAGVCTRCAAVTAQISLYCFNGTPESVNKGAHILEPSLPRFSFCLFALSEFDWMVLY